MSGRSLQKVIDLKLIEEANEGNASKVAELNRAIDAAKAETADAKLAVDAAEHRTADAVAMAEAQAKADALRRQYTDGRTAGRV